MVKEKKKLKEFMAKLGSGTKQIAIASASHPVTACLFIMGLTTLCQIVNGNPSPNDKRRYETRGQLAGLYDGAQKLGAAAVAVPVITGALGVVKSGVEAYGRKTPEASKGLSYP